MNKLAITTLLATTTLAGVAHAGKDWKPNPEILKDILDDSKRMEVFGTVGKPLADELDRGLECTTFDPFKFGFDLYEQAIAGVKFNIGFGGHLTLVSDSQKIGVELAAGPTVDVFGSVEEPAQVVLSALTKDSGKNAVELSIRVFGMDVATRTIADTATPISVTEMVGWTLPNVLDGMLGDSYDCPFITSGCSLTWSASSQVVANIGGLVLFEVKPSGVQARALVNSHAFAEVRARVDIVTPLGEASGEIGGRIDVVDMELNARGQMLARNGDWIADGAVNVQITDAMRADLGVTVQVPYVGEFYHSFFKLHPYHYELQREFSCAFKPELKTGK